MGGIQQCRLGLICRTGTVLRLSAPLLGGPLEVRQDSSDSTSSTIVVSSDKSC